MITSKSRVYFTATISRFGYFTGPNDKVFISANIDETPVMIEVKHHSINLKSGDMVTFRCLKPSKRNPKKFVTSGHYKLQARKYSK